MSRSYGLTEWREDLKMILKKAGTGEQHIVFLFSDTQIKNEIFLEAISSILSIGEIPGLYPTDEKHTICDKMRNIDARGTRASRWTDGSPAALWSLFVERVRETAARGPRDVACGEAFRTPEEVPALLSCCTSTGSKWFRMVPERFFTDLEWFYMVLESFWVVLEAVLDSPRALLYDPVWVLEIRECSSRARANGSNGRVAGRRPRSSGTQAPAGRRAPGGDTEGVCVLVPVFPHFHAGTLRQVKKLECRYTTGLARLEEAETSVLAMQQELLNLQPILLTKTREVERVVRQDEEVERVVRQDEEVANEAAEAANGIRKECEAELNLALPLLEEATAALNTIKQDDIVFIKAMKNPPSGVKLVMEAVCVLLGEKPDRVPDPQGTGKMVEEYWSVSKRLLGDIKFKARVLCCPTLSNSPSLLISPSHPSPPHLPLIPPLTSSRLTPLLSPHSLVLPPSPYPLPLLSLPSLSPSHLSLPSLSLPILPLPLHLSLLISSHPLPSVSPLQENLLNFDKENISQKAIQTIRSKYRDNDEFKPEKIKVARPRRRKSEFALAWFGVWARNVSNQPDLPTPSLCKWVLAMERYEEVDRKRCTACASGCWPWSGLCKWVLAMERYEEVDRKVAPKREALQRADQQYQGLMGELRKKQEALRGVQEELAGLQAELDTVKKEKLELEQTVELCSIKKDRAEQLLAALGGEKTRWTDNAHHLAQVYIYLTGRGSFAGVFSSLIFLLSFCLLFLSFA
ncbi:hypothetical protein C7M84_024054 [Penaeus vannamei]|uniref:Uncharacterized protein n=1 Tax=Penaeus vannamei TaxID=6689 RepID=A0A423U241_PENVA|nr:hypothetical protein C7M84_024054 [Penaeus vannamei]